MTRKSVQPTFEVQLPKQIVQEAMAMAAITSVSLEEFVLSAIEEKLSGVTDVSPKPDPENPN